MTAAEASGVSKIAVFFDKLKPFEAISSPTEHMNLACNFTGQITQTLTQCQGFNTGPYHYNEDGIDGIGVPVFNTDIG